jgi:hypothetical protein
VSQFFVHTLKGAGLYNSSNNKREEKNKTVIIHCYYLFIYIVHGVCCVVNEQIICLCSLIFTTRSRRFRVVIMKINR